VGVGQRASAQRRKPAAPRPTAIGAVGCYSGLMPHLIMFLAFCLLGAVVACSM